MISVYRVYFYTFFENTDLHVCYGDDFIWRFIPTAFQFFVDTLAEIENPEHNIMYIYQKPKTFLNDTTMNLNCFKRE